MKNKPPTHKAKINDTPLIQICRRIIELSKRCGIKKYSSKYSNKIFTNYQQIVLLCLKQKSGAGFKSRKISHYYIFRIEYMQRKKLSLCKKKNWHNLFRRGFGRARASFKI
ncbi:hypothetical protein HZA96_04350 [Candidatus Woesearchaeota archaeon]|nr:hypothetical protein [Candidatus Woesearchaeota archaeon]